MVSQIYFVFLCYYNLLLLDFCSALSVSRYSITHGKLLTTSFGNRDAYSLVECGGYCDTSSSQGTPCSAVTFNGSSRTCHLSDDDGSNVADVDDVNTVTLILMQDTTCSAPSAPPANGFVSDNGYTATYSCAGGWTLNGDVSRTCVNGVWAGAEPTCVSECGDISYLNVKVQNPVHCTYEGCTATLVGCATGFTLDSNFNFPVTLSCISGNWNTSPYVPACEYEMMFRGTADNGYNITAAYLHGTDGATTDPMCMDVHGTSCTGHYRSPKIDTWENLGITRVKYEMYDASGNIVMSVLINGTGSSLTDWLGNDVEVRALSMPWTDIVSGNTSWWSLLNDVQYGRTFRILNYYGGSCQDFYYSVVLFEPPYGCNYESHGTWPKFLYSTQPFATNFNVGDYALASSLGVWVKYGV